MSLKPNFSWKIPIYFRYIKAVDAYGVITEGRNRPPGGSSEALVKDRNILLDNQINQEGCKLTKLEVFLLYAV